MLLRLPRDLLHSVLLFTRSDDVESLRASCTGRDSTVASAPASAAGWSSFLSALSSRLSDLEHLARESQLRQQTFLRMGYKQGLDQANTAVEDEEKGLMRAPFREGFIAGAHSEGGWSDAASKGIVAALACFAAKHATTLFAASPDVVRSAAEINNVTNRKLVSIPLAATSSVATANPVKAVGAPSSSKPAAVARATVALERSCSGSDGGGCACAAKAAAASESASADPSTAGGCCSSKSGSKTGAGSCCSSSASATSSSSTAASIPDDLPDLEPTASLAPAPSDASKLDGSGAAAYHAMQPLFGLLGVTAEGLESIRTLPPAAPAAATVQASTPTATSDVSAASAASSAPVAATRPAASAPAPANRSSVEFAQMATLDW